MVDVIIKYDILKKLNFDFDYKAIIVELDRNI